jgi:hypothetical protein
VATPLQGTTFLRADMPRLTINALRDSQRLIVHVFRFRSHKDSRIVTSMFRSTSEAKIQSSCWNCDALISSSSY